MWKIFLTGEVVNNHDELMSNFFAQPDALAYGKVQKHCFQLFFPVLACGALNFRFSKFRWILLYCRPPKSYERKMFLSIWFLTRYNLQKDLNVPDQTLGFDCILLYFCFSLADFFWKSTVSQHFTPITECLQHWTGSRFH